MDDYEKQAFERMKNDIRELRSKVNDIQLTLDTLTKAQIILGIAYLIHVLTPVIKELIEKFT